MVPPENSMFYILSICKFGVNDYIGRIIYTNAIDAAPRIAASETLTLYGARAG
jgi:hypothetical protein